MCHGFEPRWGVLKDGALSESLSKRRRSLLCRRACALGWTCRRRCDPWTFRYSGRLFRIDLDPVFFQARTVPSASGFGVGEPTLASTVPLCFPLSTLPDLEHAHTQKKAMNFNRFCVTDSFRFRTVIITVQCLSILTQTKMKKKKK